MPLVLRLAHGTMAALFFLSALLQFNDPHPLAWIALYTGAGVASLCAALRKATIARITGGLIFLICLLAEIPYLKARPWETPLADLTREWKMTHEAIVDGREFYALIWIAVWMLVTVLTLRSSPPSATPATAA